MKPYPWEEEPPKKVAKANWFGMLAFFSDERLGFNAGSTRACGLLSGFGWGFKGEGCKACKGLGFLV